MYDEVSGQPERSGRLSLDPRPPSTACQTRRKETGGRRCSQRSSPGLGQLPKAIRFSLWLSSHCEKHSDGTTSTPPPKLGRLRRCHGAACPTRSSTSSP